MDIKKIIIIVAIALLMIIGFNYYKGVQTKKNIEARKADTEILRQQIKQGEIDKARNTQIQLEREELESMPLAAQEIIATKERNSQHETQYENIDLEKEDRAKLDDIMNRWDDASAVASRTSRISLSNVVLSMQALKREADSLTVTPCLTRAQANMLVGMDSEITAYLKFMSDSKASISTDILGKYEAHAKYYEIVKKCTG